MPAFSPHASMPRLPDPLASVARLAPTRPFVVSPDWAVTYGEADRRVEYAAQALVRAGLGREDRLALYQPGEPPEPECVLRDIVLLLAGWRAGLTMLPLSARLPPATAEALLRAIGGAARVGEHRLHPEHLLDGEQEPAGIPEWRSDDFATIVLTSGSTGAPKAAVHTVSNHVWSARGLNEWLRLTPQDRWQLKLPLCHVAGLGVLFRCLLAGAAVAVPRWKMPPGESVPILGTTCLSMVSTQLRRALDTDARLDRLRVVLLGGSGFPEDMLREAHARRWPISTSYGLTEMTSTVAATAPRAPLAVLATAGVVLPHREVSLAADGEVRLRGRVRFAGYLSASGLQKPFDEEGWFSSGDLGEWHEVVDQRMLRITGRKDGRFVSGGENVQPEAIEAVLLRQAGVTAALVVPVASREFGRRPVAFVESETWAPGAWERALVAELPRFMVPDAFYEWPADLREADRKPSRASLSRTAEQLRKAKGA